MLSCCRIIPFGLGIAALLPHAAAFAQVPPPASVVPVPAEAPAPEIMPPPVEPVFPNSDFELGTLKNWRSEGSAFVLQPTLEDNAARRSGAQPALPQGRYWAGSFERYQGKPGEAPGGYQGDAPKGGLISGPFTINRPYISFLVGGGAGEMLSVQLVVEGQAVRSETGANCETMREVVWEVGEYVDRTAVLYIQDQSGETWGHINADAFHWRMDLPELRLFPNSDFEQGTLNGWNPVGEAFAAQPTRDDNVAARMENKVRAQPQGQWWVGSFEKFQGKDGEKPGTAQNDAPQGTLGSPSFTILRSPIAFRLGGGAGPGVSVVLMVDGREVRTARGKNRETMAMQVWDVAEWVGQTATIEIRDRESGPWGHVNVDDFRYLRAE